MDTGLKGKPYLFQEKKTRVYCQLNVLTAFFNQKGDLKQTKNKGQPYRFSKQKTFRNGQNGNLYMNRNDVTQNVRAIIPLASYFVILKFEYSLNDSKTLVIAR